MQNFANLNNWTKVTRSAWFGERVTEAQNNVHALLALCPF